jgi:7-cyano-7-deazaguanine reductase
MKGKNKLNEFFEGLKETYKKEVKSRKDRIDSSVLKAIPYTEKKKVEITYTTNEFTCLCPWTGLPDFGKLTITYLPSNKVIELKSLKFYLLSFRNVGIINEHAVARILEDLSTLVNPEWMEVRIEFTPRGGIQTIASARYPEKKCK